MKSKPETAITSAPVTYPVPDYNTGTPEERERMDAILEALPSGDAMAAFGFGAEPMKHLDRVSRAVMQHTGMDSDLMAQVRRVEETVAAIDLDRLKSYANSFAAQTGLFAQRNKAALLASGVAMVALSVPSAVGIGAATAAYQKIQKYRAGPSVDDAADALREQAAQIGDVIRALEDADREIPSTLEQTDHFSRALATAMEETLLHIGAGEERLRQLREIEIPQAEQSCTQNASPQKNLNLKNLRSQEGVLGQRLRDMRDGIAAFTACDVMLSDMAELLFAAALKTRSHLEHSAPMWRAFMAMAGLQLVGHEIATANTAADAFGGGLMKKTAALHRSTAAQIAASTRTGTFDPAQIEEALKSLQGVMTDANTLLGRRQELAEARARVEQGMVELQGQIGALGQKRQALMAGNGNAAPQLPSRAAPALPAPKAG